MGFLGNDKEKIKLLTWKLRERTGNKTGKQYNEYLKTR